MALEISPSLAKDLPSGVKTGLAKASPELQNMFEEEFKKKKLGVVGRLFFTFFLCPFHFFKYKKPGLFWLYFFILGGLGIWYVLELFLVKKRVVTYNQDLSITLWRDIKMMNM